jgi:hypothetical protein
MGADLVISLECPAKARLGAGPNGTTELVRLKKLKSQSEALLAMVHESGGDRDPKSIVVNSVLQRPGATKQTETSLQDLLDEGAQLDALASHCVGCKANLFDNAFGCWGYVKYPITESGEAWIMARVQPAATLGGTLLLKAIDDFGYDGSKFAKYREQDLCELEEPVVKVVRKGLLFNTKVNANQIFDTIFTRSEALNPTHCMMILLWLGALEVDGKVSLDASGAIALKRLLGSSTPEEREATGKLQLGDKSTDPGIAAMQTLLEALHRAWVLDVALLVDG